jgi:hypothetical protein
VTLLSCANKTHNHAYHQALVYKIFCAGKPGKVYNTFEQTLEVIRKVHGFTAGAPQIVYLIGWQFDGHDSKYPDWSIVNPRLKRPQDDSARQGLIWLMKAAHDLNATVSLHVNMCDAYEDSPLWKEYVQADLLIRGADGALQKGGVWGGQQSYLICKAREWASGHARRRIDRLLELLPIKNQGTIHIDVFCPRASPYHCVSREDDLAVMVAIVRYWKDNGVDVTSEWWQHELAGLIPMVWHLNWDEASRLKYSPEFACGGGSGWNMRQPDSSSKPNGFCKMPEAGCLYEEAWGRSVDCDIYTDTDQLREEFYTRTLPWMFLNRHRAVGHSLTREAYDVMFADNITTRVTHVARHLTLRWDDRTLVDGDDLFMPVIWRQDACIAYSRHGGSKTWKAPASWRQASKAILELLPDGSGSMARSPHIELPIVDGKITLVLPVSGAAIVRPMH